jgi:hypothetical protein
MCKENSEEGSDDGAPGGVQKHERQSKDQGRSEAPARFLSKSFKRLPMPQSHSNRLQARGKHTVPLMIRMARTAR